MNINHLSSSGMFSCGICQCNECKAGRRDDEAEARAHARMDEMIETLTIKDLYGLLSVDEQDMMSEAIYRAARAWK